jgi:DNA-binding winged helix-turn-helix (wHTH) protein/tetratricopeptide (TPR) repeat protein
MAKIFRFDNFILDTNAFELRLGPVIIPVEPLVFDLITFLLGQPGVVLSRDLLVDAVWDGRIVSESTISTAIKSARKALGDSGREQKYIRTIRGRGIQFVVPVETDLTEAAESRPPLLDNEIQLKIYVRPFETMGESSLDQLSHLLQVRTASILTRIPLLRVMASFPQADNLEDLRELRSQFNITHVLEVRLQRLESRLTANATIIETRNLVQIWAQQVEDTTGAGEQERLLHKLISRIEPRMMQAMVAEFQLADGGDSSRANLLRAITLLSLKGWHQTTFIEATRMIESAIEQEPDLALSYAYLALLKALGHRVGLLRNDDTIVPTAIVAAEKALELQNQDSTILGLVGCALADVGQVNRALPILKKAIDLDSQNGHAKTALGAALMLKGDYKNAVRYLSDGINCSPADSRLSVWGAVLALGYLALGESENALVAAENACKEDDRLYLPRLSLAAVHLMRKDQDNAVAAVKECVRTKSDLNREEVTRFIGEKLGASAWAIAKPLIKKNQRNRVGPS